MAGLDDVLERLVNDGAFRTRLATDPASALRGYDLGADDVEILATTLSDDAGDSSTVETRQSKSAMVGLLSQVLHLGSSGPIGSSHPPEPVSPPPDGFEPNFDPDPTGGMLDVNLPDQPGTTPLNGPAGIAEVGFNPQPEPPADPFVPSFDPDPTGGMLDVNLPDQPGTTPLNGPAGIAEVGFNPQPEPPADPAMGIVPCTEPVGAPQGTSGTPGLQEVGFNPQPEPPADPAMGIVPCTEPVGAPANAAMGIVPCTEPVGANPPCDGVVGGNPPDDGFEGMAGGSL